MFINADSLIIEGVSMGQYLISVEYGWNKVWGSDTGRNMKFAMTGTYGGVVPKLRLTFRPTTQNELELLAPILDKATQSVTYYDPVLKRMTTMTTYTGDWVTRNKNTFTNVARANEQFDISFIATKPREQ